MRLDGHLFQLGPAQISCLNGRRAYTIYNIIDYIGGRRNEYVLPVTLEENLDCRTYVEPTISLDMLDKTSLYYRHTHCDDSTI